MIYPVESVIQLLEQPGPELQALIEFSRVYERSINVCTASKQDPTLRKSVKLSFPTKYQIISLPRIYAASFDFVYSDDEFIEAASSLTSVPS